MFEKFKCFCIKEAEGLEVGKGYECEVHSIPIFLGDDWWYWTEIDGKTVAYKGYLFSKYLKKVVYMTPLQEEYNLTTNKQYFVVGVDVRDGYRYLVFDDKHEFVLVPSMFFNVVEEIGYVVWDFNKLEMDRVRGKKQKI